MIEFLFLLCWTAVFLFTGFLIWKRVAAHIKVYLILVLNLIFLTGIFYLYPLALKMALNL